MVIDGDSGSTCRTVSWSHLWFNIEKTVAKTFYIQLSSAESGGGGRDWPIALTLCEPPTATKAVSYHHQWHSGESPVHIRRI
jgi:hypothetical protein